MLFPVQPETPNFLVFNELNREFINFLHVCINADAFGSHLFTSEIGKACFANSRGPNGKSDLTKDKFEHLWSEIEKLTEAERNTLYNIVNDNQELEVFFNDPRLLMPVIAPDTLKDKLKILTTHLFEHTKSLALVKQECDNESIKGHFNRFRRLNGNVCLTCGTELLDQKRDNILDESQWRSDYDHLLCKKENPIYAVHPDNLFPLCDTCNKKAKRAKELLENADGVRRRCFFPKTEYAGNYIAVELDDDDLSPSLCVIWTGYDDISFEKLETWDSVYQIKNRVQGEQADYVVWLDKETKALDFEDFILQLARHNRQPRGVELKSEAWLFWRHKLYEWLGLQGDVIKRQIWDMILQRRDDVNFAEEFGL